MKYNSFPILAAMGSLLCLLALLLSVEAIELNIIDLAVPTSIRLDVFSHRNITLGSGRNYVLSCLSTSYSPVWSSNLVITNPPNDNTTSAVFLQPSKQNLMLQNFNSELSGNYTCSVMGEEKSVTILSSNPAVVTSTKKLFLTLGDTPSHNKREQRILTYGNPSPTFSDIRWFLNDTIPVSTLSGITVTMNGLTFPALTTYELSGKYTVVVNTSAGMVQDSFTVLVGIAPFPVVTPSTIQAVVGERKNITCVDTQAVPPPQFHWSKCPVKNNCTRLENGQDDLSFLSTRHNTTVLIMNPVLLTHGGLYRCDAENGIKRTGRDVAVELSLPQPQSVNVSVSPGPYFAGQSAQLVCTASLRLNTVVGYNDTVSTFVWKKGNQIMNTSNGRLLVTDLMTKGSFRSQQLTIDPISHSHDSHQQYHCEVVLAVNGIDITSLPMTSPAVPIDVTVPLTEFQVSPKQITALDVSPYNGFNITCSTENHRNFSLEYRWFNGKDELTNGQDGISVSSDRSVINIVASMPGIYIVSCKVRGSLLDQELFNVELESLITIRGPSVPLLPTGLTTTRIKYDQVDIELLINNISYTPEQYFIVYGTNSQYQYRSDVYTGSNDIATNGERVTITLTNLQYSQQYQYRVVARNSAGTVESQVFTFRTEPIVLLQVRAGPFQGCLADKVQHSSLVSEFFRSTIVEAINRKCFCNFPITNLINGTMFCPQDGSRDLVYRGYLVRLDHLSSNQLLSYADAWIKSKPRVPSGVALVEFNPNCSTTVSSMNESVCPRNYMSPLADQGFLFDNAVILVVTVVVTLLLILVVIVLILIGVVVTQHKQISFLKRRKNNVYEIARQESLESASDGSASGTSGSAVSKNDAVIIPSEAAPPTVSGFAERQGVDWSKETSVTDCPAYTTVYLHSEPSDARQDNDSTPASSPTKSIPCIYDTVSKVPRGIHYGTTNPRLAVISCADDDDDDDIDDSSTECETVGL